MTKSRKNRKRTKPTVSSKKRGRGIVCKKLGGSYTQQNKNVGIKRKLEAINQEERGEI